MNPGIKRLLKNPASFLTDVPDNPVCISTRVRLSRNIGDLPFPAAATPECARQIIRDVREAAENSTVLGCPECSSFLLEELDPLEREILLERRLASREFIEQTAPAALIVRGGDENCAVMINEEDQLRMQVLLPGEQLDAAWKLMNRLDDELGEKLAFAYDEKLGYLTACPTNLGTGLRASVMLHLPGLSISGQIAATVHGIGKLGLAVRGIFGEGTGNSGNLYQVSNQSTLGESEENIIANLKPVIRQLADQELRARQALLEQDRYALLDHVGRAYGVLTNSYRLGTDEALNSLSGVRLGVDLGLFKKVDVHLVNELFLELNAAHLQARAGMLLPESECNIRRSELFRKKLKRTK